MAIYAIKPHHTIREIMSLELNVVREKDMASKSRNETENENALMMFG